MLQLETMLGEEKHQEVVFGERRKHPDKGVSTLRGACGGGEEVQPEMEGLMFGEKQMGGCWRLERRTGEVTGATGGVTEHL